MHKKSPLRIAIISAWLLPILFLQPLARANNVGCTTIVSGGLTGLAAIGGFFFPPTLIGTGGIIVGEVAGAGTDAYRLTKNMDPGCTALLTGPAATPDIAQLAAFTSHVLPIIPLPHTSAADDAYIGAVNGLISEFDRLTADFNANLPAVQLQNDIYAESAAMNLIASLTQARPQGSAAFTQSDFNAAFTSIRTGGLPAVEASYLTSAGWSASDLSGLASYTGALPFTLAVPSVTTNDLDNALVGLLAPEPSSWSFVGLGAIGLLVLGSIRRRKKG